MKLCVVMLVMMRMEYVVEMFQRVGICCREWEYFVESGNMLQRCLQRVGY